MKATSIFLASVVVSCLWACKSSGSETAAAEPVGLTEPDRIDCICGQPDANLVGCHHPLCMSDRGNPDNPDCVCGGLAVVPARQTLTSTGNAQETSRLLGQQQVLYLASGTTVRGTPIADDGLSVELRMSDGSGRTYAYTDLDPRSVYRLMKGRASRDDGAAQIEVGNYARDHGYYAHARRHYDQALAADRELGARVEHELGILRERAAGEELAKARTALSKGETGAAEEHLATVLKEFPGERAAESAAAMLNDIHAREATMTRSAPDLEVEVAADFDKVREYYDRGVEENRKGLLASKNQSRALRHFDSALKNTQKARQEIGGVMKSNEDSPAHRRAADDWERRSLDLVIDVDLNMASIYMTRESFNSALERVNHAIAVDPANQEARNMRARIEVAASNDNWGWGWRR